MTWVDHRSIALGTGTSADLFALRVTGEGALPTGWPVDGAPLTRAPRFQFRQTLTADGAGGVFVAWQDERSGSTDLYAQHILGSGELAPGWDPDGQPVCTAVGRQDDPVSTTDGAGGALVAWADSRNGGQQIDIHAHKLGIDGPVPTLPTLKSAEADGSGIRIVWFAHEARTLEANVYRRTEETVWSYLGAAEASGPDELRYNDSAVVRGERYAYRLGYMDGGTEHFTGEVWVETAPPLVLALEGFRPNPAHGMPSVAFVLPEVGSATIEVFDIRGRRVLRQDVSALGVGRHSVRLATSPLPPGLYWIRLQTPRQTLTTRGVLLP